MSDNRNGCGGGVGGVILDAMQVFDSCRDRDCFEDVRVFLDEIGQSLIERTCQIRTRAAEICSSAISIEPVGLSRGFFRVTVRYYVRLEFEACLCPGKAQSFAGLAAVEKSVVLYGGESSVKIFRSSAVSDSFCSRPCTGEMTGGMPEAVAEAVDPVILGTRVIDPAVCPCRCFCSCEDIPESLSCLIGSGLVDSRSKYLAVSLGFFSVIRLERPAQFVVDGLAFHVPDKECAPVENGNPCDAFRRMAFPIGEFSAGNAAPFADSGCGCGSRSGDPDSHGDGDSRGGSGSGSGCGCRSRAR